MRRLRIEIGLMAREQPPGSKGIRIIPQISLWAKSSIGKHFKAFDP